MSSDVETGARAKAFGGYAPPETEPTLDSLIASNDVVMLSRKGCGFCIEAKRVLGTLGLHDAAIIDVDAVTYGSSLRKAAIALTAGGSSMSKLATANLLVDSGFAVEVLPGDAEKRGFVTLPMIWMGNTFIGGCTELKELVSSNKVYKVMDGFRKSSLPLKAPPAADMDQAGDAVKVYPGKDSAVRLPFYFGETSDNVTNRICGCLATICAIVIAVFANHDQAAWACLGLTLDFLARFFGGAGCSPIGVVGQLIATLFRYKKEPVFMSAISKQFALMCCWTMAGCAFGLLIADYFTIGRIVLAGLAGAAGAEGFLGWCAGCMMFTIGIEFGVLPKTIHKLHLALADEKRRTWHFFNTYVGYLCAPPNETQTVKGVPPNPTDLKCKPVNDKVKWQWFDPIKYAHVTHFAAPLGVISAGFPWFLVQQYKVADVISWTGFVMFFILCLQYLTKAVLYRSKVIKEWQNPLKSGAFALIPLCFLAHSLMQRRHDTTFADSLYWIGAVLTCAVGSMHMAQIISTANSLDAVSVFWFLPPLTGLVAAIATPPNGEQWNFARYMFAYGVIAYLALWPITLQKIIFSSNNDYRGRHAIHIWYAAPACAAIALQTLQMGAYNDVVEYMFLSAVGVCAAVVCCYFPFNFFQEGKFDMSCWAVAFPLNIIASAAVLYDQVANSEASRFLYVMFMSTGGFVTLTLLIHTLRNLLEKRIFVPIAKWGPMSFWHLVHEAIRYKAEQLQLLIGESTSHTSPGFAAYVAGMKEFNANIEIHVKHEDEYMYPLLSAYFPGMQCETDLKKEHAEHHAEWDALVVRMEEVAAGTCDINVLKAEGKKFLDGMCAHLDEEEFKFTSPIIRKYLNVNEQRELIRRMWDGTDYNLMAQHVRWVVNNLPMYYQKTRAIRALCWAIPERAQMLGLWVYRGVDDANWISLARDIPEIIPKGLPGHVKYF